jgi:hypothetical protein
MSEEKAASNFWSPIKDGNAGFVFLALAFAALAFAIYFLRYRPATLSDLLPSLDRFQKISAIAAFTLFGIAAIVALWEVMRPEWQDDNSTLWSTLSSIKDLNSAAVILAAGLIVSAIAFYWLRSSEESIADLWEAHAPSLDGLRGYAVAIAGVLVTCIVVGSIIGFFWTGASSSEFTSIAPFTISGSEDKQRGMALATAFQAKLSELLRDAHVLDEVLREDAETDPETPVPNQDTSESRSLNVFPKLDLDLKFQGVDVGGVLNGVVNWMAMRRALQITVAEQQDGNAIVSGALRPDGKSHVYASVKGNENIVAAVAYSKLRDRLTAQQEDFEALDWEDIKSLHLSIMAVTRLRARSQTTMEDYKVHHEAIAKLIAKAPGLEALLALGAEVAMKAGNIDRALAYLDRTKEFLNRMREQLDQNRPAADDSAANDGEGGQDNFDDLKRKFLRKYNALVVQRQRVISSCALPFIERLNAGNSVEPIFAEAFAKHRELLRIGNFESKQEITVAIVGGIPQREQIDYNFKSSGDWIPGKYGLDNFADTIGLIVKTLAPNAKLVFVPLGPKSHARGLSLTANEGEITQAVDAAVKAKADIVVIPFTALTNAWKTRIQTVKRFAPQTAIVLPAPSKAVQVRSIPGGLPSIPAAFVASTDVDGKFKGAVLSFDESLASYPGAIWAPGMRIPRLTADGMWQTTYGSAYAAATAAAAIANVAAGSGIKEPKKLIDLIAGTLRHLDSSPDIGIVDQTTALNPPNSSPAADLPQSTCAQ